MADDIDWRASPTLTKLRELIGEEGARLLIIARGGTDIYVPGRATPDCVLAGIVGLVAAQAIVDWKGGNRLEIPNGRGLAHGERVDMGAVLDLMRQGFTLRQIARTVGCSVRNIRARVRTAEGRAEDEKKQMKGKLPTKQLDLLDYLESTKTLGGSASA